LVLFLEDLESVLVSLASFEGVWSSPLEESVGILDVYEVAVDLDGDVAGVLNVQILEVSLEGALDTALTRWHVLKVKDLRV
jgi:hypothetical protein